MKTKIREYNAGCDVHMELHTNDRWVIIAANVHGFHAVNIDLNDVVDWVKKNKPELLGR